MAWKDPNRAYINITGGAMFFMFLIFLTAVGAWIYVKHPPNVLTQVLSGTKEERTLRNLQDPLAMRLWVLSDMSFVGNSDTRRQVVEQVIKQWAEEVKDLKEKAYHSRAADMSWSLNGVDLTDEQKRKVIEVESKMKVDKAPDSW
jgi:hypothetical protein